MALPLLLLIDTGTQVCSAALARGTQVIAYRSTSAPKAHASQLAVFIEELFQQAHVTPSQCQGVCVSKGPGSYTGLRVGVSTAKGLCFGAQIPLLSVSSLQLIAQGTLESRQLPPPGGALEDLRIVPMIDARRMEVYTATYGCLATEEGLLATPLSQVEAHVVTPQSFASLLASHRVYFTGDGSAKCAEVITHPHAVFCNDPAHARYMAKAAYAAFVSGTFEDTAYFTPFYLKEFVAGTPKAAF